MEYCNETQARTQDSSPKTLKTPKTKNEATRSAIAGSNQEQIVSEPRTDWESGPAPLLRGQERDSHVPIIENRYTIAVIGRSVSEVDRPHMEVSADGY
jgi:hypothetical protein